MVCRQRFIALVVILTGWSMKQFRRIYSITYYLQYLILIQRYFRILQGNLALKVSYSRSFQRSVQKFDCFFLVIPDYHLKSIDYYYDPTWDEVVEILRSELGMVKVNEGPSRSWLDSIVDLDPRNYMGSVGDRELDDDHPDQNGGYPGFFHHQIQIPAYEQPRSFRALILLFDDASFHEVVISGDSFRTEVPLGNVGWCASATLMEPDDGAFEARFSDLDPRFNVYAIDTNPVPVDRPYWTPSQSLQ